VYLWNSGLLVRLYGMWIVCVFIYLFGRGVIYLCTTCVCVCVCGSDALTEGTAFLDWVAVRLASLQCRTLYLVSGSGCARRPVAVIASIIGLLNPARLFNFYLIYIYIYIYIYNYTIFIIYV